MKKLSIIVVLLFAGLALYLGIQRNQQKEKERSGEYFETTEENSFSVAKVKTSAKMGANSVDAVNESKSSLGKNPKVSQQGGGEKKNQTHFDSFLMTDTEYSEWERFENSKNGALFGKAFEAYFDKDKNGTVSKEERSAGHQEISTAFNDAKKIMQRAFDKDGDGLSKEEESSMNKEFGRSIRAKRDQVYGQFGYDLSTQSFPAGNQEEMCEYIVNNFSVLINEIAHETLSKSLAL